jgi:hypothetical protein
MDRAPKEFYGYSNESARGFIEKLNTYLQLKGVVVSRWVNVFQALIQGLARESLEIAIAPGEAIHADIAGNVAMAAARAAGATDAQREAGHQAEYAIGCQWLTDTYANAEVMQELQEDVMKMKQEANEAPKDFHARIRHAMRLAGMAAAVTPFVLQTVFEQGLHPDIKMHVESLGTAQPMTKLNRAQGYWNAHNGKGRNLMQEMPEAVKERLQLPTTIASKQDFIPKATLQTNSVNQLVSEFKKMSAHIADMDRRIQAR